MIEFEWDEQKNSSNQCKHGLFPEEATRVFLDPLCLCQEDWYENGDARWQALDAVK